MRRWALILCGAALAVPVQAQDVAPVPIDKPAAAPAPAVAADSNVAPFYAARPGRLVWLAGTDSRAAAAKLVEILKRASIDGFAEGPTIASFVETAIAGGTAADDQTISSAWVRYVQALRRPVDGVSFGDATLQLAPPNANKILAETLAAPSLTAHVEAVAGINPFYAALRDNAFAAGQQDDPHVRATLDRLRLLPAKGRAILVDVANAQLMELENGKVVDTMKVIVGKPDFPTPLLAGKIWYVTFNPYWHIPLDVAKRKVAPIVLKRGVSYLTAARYETVAAFSGDDKEEAVDPKSIDWKAVAAGTADAHIRQLTGPNNMMGKMKFGFVNDYGIFLHDTPHKDLFLKEKRNLSLGCVRVERPSDFAEWLFRHTPPVPGSDAEQNVRIDQGVPIYISYLTARADGDKIAFADDVYKLDAAPAGGTAVVAATAPADK